LFEQLPVDSPQAHGVDDHFIDGVDDVLVCDAVAAGSLVDLRTDLLYYEISFM
jgi:hypothetical protein